MKRIPFTIGGIVVLAILWWAFPPFHVRSLKKVRAAQAGAHERALRVIGRWMDEQKPRDVFLFEQDGAYVVRLLVSGQGAAHHVLAEFTAEDVDGLVARGPSLRAKTGSTTPVAGG